MKRLFTILLSATLVLAPLAAFDFGGYIGNDSSIIKLGEADPYFNQSNSIFLWASAPIGEHMYIKGEGMYKYNYDTASEKFVNYVDLDLLKLAGEFSIAPGKLDFALGRFNFSDLTGTIFSQNSDGAFAKLTAKKFNVSLYAGFTGLLNSNIVNILDKGGVIHSPENEVYSLNANYIPVLATVSLPSLFLNQTISLQASGFIDVSENNYNRMYATIDFTGPITSMLFYNLATTFGTENFDSIMNLSNLSFSIFPMSNLFVNAGVLFASGEILGMNSFIGFSSHPAFNAAFPAETTSCLIPSISANLSILQDKMLLALTGKGVFTTFDDSFKATGVQGDLSAIYNIFPDFQVGLSGSLFKGFSDYSALDKFSATLKFAVTF